MDDRAVGRKTKLSGGLGVNWLPTSRTPTGMDKIKSARGVMGSIESRGPDARIGLLCRINFASESMDKLDSEAENLSEATMHHVEWHLMNALFSPW